MGYPVPLSDYSADVNADATEQTRNRLIRTIKTLPPDVLLFRDLLDWIRVVTGRSPSRHKEPTDVLDDQTRVCCWIVHVGTWIAWLL